MLTKQSLKLHSKPRVNQLLYIYIASGLLEHSHKPTKGNVIASGALRGVVYLIALA